MIASPRGPPRSRCADFPPRAYETGKTSSGTKKANANPTVIQPSRSEYTASTGWSAPRSSRASTTSPKIAKTPARASLRGRPEGASTITAPNSVTDRAATGNERKDRRGVGREDAHALRLGALGGQDRVQEVDHDVQGEDRDQVSPPLGERGDDEDDEADDPDHERVTQGIEDLSEVDERGRPQVLEPPQDRGLRVRVDDRLMDRDAGGEQRERRPPPRAPPRLSREGGWLARRPAARSSVREPSVGAFGPGHGRCEIPMEAVCRRLDRDRQASGLVDLVTRCDRERIHERPERRGRKACQGSPTAGTRPGRKA